MAKKNSTVNVGVIIGIIVSAVVVVTGVAVVAVLLLGKGGAQEGQLEQTAGPESEKERRAVVTAENVEEIAEELFTPTDNGDIPQSYTVTQNSEWHFPDGSSASTDAYVENVRDNETPVYFEVIVDETQQVVYSSPVLELGASISDFSLDEPLSKGEYVCTVLYHLVDDDQNELTTVRVGGTLVVEN